MVRTKNRLQITAAVTNGSFTVNENGMIRAIVYVLPNYTTAVSGVLSLKDTEGDTIYTSGTINDTGTTLVSSLAVPVSGVRSQAGIHAERINLLFQELLQGHMWDENELREVFGHTPLEVIVWILLGFFVAITQWLIWP